jgi:hypothetical protein
MLPKLDAEHARLRVDEEGRVVAMYEYDLSVGEWVRAVPAEWREFAAGLPKGAWIDAERGRVYDASIMCCMCWMWRRMSGGSRYL